MFNKSVPMEYDDWTLYEAQEFDDRSAILYKHNYFEVWCVIEEQMEAGAKTHYATMFVDREEYEANKEEIGLQVQSLIRAINVSLMWNVDELRPLTGGVAEAYVFGDFV